MRVAGKPFQDRVQQGVLFEEACARDAKAWGSGEVVRDGAGVWGGGSCEAKE